MVSVRKFASLAGVSPMTVSRALREQPGVGETLRTRIQALAEQYHYHPNRLTHGVMTGATRTLGCVLPSMQLSFYNRLL